MKKAYILWLILFLSFFRLDAQIHEPVKFETGLQSLSAGEAEILFNVAIDAGWRVYSAGEAGGPAGATFHLDSIAGAELAGELSSRGDEIAKYDNVLQTNVRYFENSVRFAQKVHITQAAYQVWGYLEYTACNDKLCLPPMQIPVHFSGIPVQTPLQTPVQPALAGSDWAPVIDELNAFGETASQHQTWFYIFLAGFAGGLLALLTPCVWPVIPMTVSFFLKRSGDKKKNIRDAITYGICVIVIYVAPGLALTLVFGAGALNALSTHAAVNIFFFLMLLLFAASFLGAFDITLPSKWSTATDGKAESAGGRLGIFLMASTLAIVSFSCTGPLIGLLLVQAGTSGSVIAPAAGMFGFAIALALPFTLFALFPSWLKSVPKPGSWMNTIKVTLGFIEIAFALKFLSLADLAYGWGILSRETFLALWIALFTLLSLYLLGKITFHNGDTSHVTLPRFFLALSSLAFAIYLFPGLWGAPLKAVSAFAPPLNTQDFNLYTREVHPQFDDYDAGMNYARLHHKPAMLNFTGYGCANCRKMELAVWTNPQVSSIINNDYVLITLHVDSRQPLPQPIKITENGAERTLRTAGHKWSYLQRTKFGANAQPFYLLIDNQGHPLNKPYAYNEDISQYINFLQTGLKHYKP
jgi:thiol:disulfide interchange protein DsbD